MNRLNCFFFRSGLGGLLVLALLTTCEKPDRDNPWDYFANLNPGTWAPRNLEIEPVTITSKKLTWHNGDDRIEGFQLDKKAGDANWQIGVAYFDKETREWLDEDIVPDNNITYHYRISLDIISL